jgi:hypothetical protein
MAPRNEEDKYLVAEQPGLGLSFIGLFLAFFVGLAIRAAVAPERVQAHLHEAIQNIHQDVKIDFGNAYVSFSRGFWPDLSVIIENVKIESPNSCWLTPLAEINQIRLPLSMRHLFRGEILIHEVIADEVNLSLRSTYQNCPDKREVAAEKPSAKKPELTLTPSQQPVIADFENVKRDNPIDTVLIGHLKIHYLPIAFTSFEIADFRALLKSEQPRWVQILGQLQEPTANLQLDFHEGDNASVGLLMNGAWSEGQYNLQAHFNSKTNILTFESNLKQLPLSRIIPILKKYRWVESEFNGKRAWLSGKMRMEGLVSELAKTPFYFSDFKLEGDLGEVSCSKAEIQSWQPFKFKPTEFQLRGLNIKEFLLFLNRPHPSPALGDLGLFNGVATFISPENVQLRGDYSGLEFIFSNQGSRQVQALSLVSGELELRKDQWNIQIDRIKPVEGIFEGNVKIQADKNFKDMKLEARIAELGLSPKVQNLMTNGGSLGAMSGQLQAHLKSAQISQLKGHLKWDQLLVNGVRLQRPKAQIQTAGQGVEMKISAQELEILPHTLAASLFQPVLGQQLKNESEAFVLKSPSASIRTKKFQSLSWSQFQGQTTQGALRSSGEWNEKSELKGQLQLLGSKKRMWEIMGTRSQPRFAEFAYD